LPFKIKKEIQTLVKNALRPHYRSNEVSADEYTTINRDVSRQLYEKIGGEEALADRDHWQKVAEAEVAQAIRTLRTEAKSIPLRPPPPGTSESQPQVVATAAAS
jgi:hypothetical protein